MSIAYHEDPDAWYDAQVEQALMNADLARKARIENGQQGRLAEAAEGVDTPAARFVRHMGGEQP